MSSLTILSSRLHLLVVNMITRTSFVGCIIVSSIYKYARSYNNNYNNNHNNTRTSTMRKNEKLGNVMYRNNINERNNTKIDSNNRSQHSNTKLPKL